MAPIAVESTTHPATGPAVATKAANGTATQASYPRPLQLTGVLDKYAFNESTPVIGREYPTLQAKELLNAPNADELLRELAIISK